MPDRDPQPEFVTHGEFSRFANQTNESLLSIQSDVKEMGDKIDVSLSKFSEQFEGRISSTRPQPSVLLTMLGMAAAIGWLFVNQHAEPIAKRMETHGKLIDFAMEEMIGLRRTLDQRQGDFSKINRIDEAMTEVKATRYTRDDGLRVEERLRMLEIGFAKLEAQR